MVIAPAFRRASWAACWALGVLVSACTPSTPAARTAARAASLAAPVANADVAVFAGGCFWCLETQFEGLPGVIDVVSGYAGGALKNPTYEQVGTQQTGHYESVQIRFDPAKTSYARLLDVFWHSIDPTQADGQFCDIGASYRSAIFPRNESQRRSAEESKRRIEASGVLKKAIVTPILPAATFYRAEEYHQDFWKKDPVRYKTYRFGCGRDRRTAQIWGKLAAQPNVH